MAKNEKNTAPERIKPSTDQWRTLYDAAAELKALAPWEKLDNMNLIVITLPGEEEPYFCSLLGNGGQAYGVAVYPGYVAFSQLMRLHYSASGPLPMLFLLDQRSINCHFGDREDIEKEDREPMKALGLRFRGRGQWTYFRSMKPGQFPWMISAEEADCLCRLFPHLLDACRCCLDGGYEFDDASFMKWSCEDGQWRASSLLRSKIQLAIPIPVFDPEEQASLEKARKTKKSLELDAWYLPVPIQDKRSAAPHSMHMAILADRKDDMILDQQLTPSDESTQYAWVALLCSYIEKHGRPANLYVRDEWMAMPIKQLCNDLGIKLHIGKRMQIMDDIFFSLFTGFVDVMGDDDDDDSDLFGEFDDSLSIFRNIAEDDFPERPDNVIKFPK